MINQHEISVTDTAFQNVQNVTLHCKILAAFELFVVDVSKVGYDKVVRLRCPHCRKLSYLITSKAG